MLSPNVTGIDPWDIVAYEARMLFGLWRVLASKQNAPVGDIINNAMVESACLHARVLIDIFLSKDCARADDVPELECCFSRIARCLYPHPGELPQSLPSHEPGCP